MASKKKRNPSRAQRDRTPPRRRSTEDVLQSASEALSATAIALEDYLSARTFERKRAALRNFIMNGRTVTWALQHLPEDRPPDGGAHGPWYQREVVDRFANDPIGQLFIKLRNLVEKEGILESTPLFGGLMVDNIMAFDAFANEHEPPGTTGRSITDDGNVRYETNTGFVEIPYPGVRHFSVDTFAEASALPDLAGRTIDEVSLRYFGILRDVVAAAHNTFLPLEQ